LSDKTFARDIVAEAKPILERAKNKEPEILILVETRL